jgi:peptidoglycan/xylan/chitin deacetylase (PgdA/CDA1 family)
MTKLNLYTLLFTFIVAAISCTHDHGDGTHRHPAQNNYHEHPEVGVKLPFDSPYCDLNGDQNISANEMKSSNLCIIEGADPLFATRPIASLGLQKGELLLTIDDGPNANVTRPILDLLDQYNIKATFFVVGSRIRDNADIIRDMINRGHTIGNHTYSHDVEGITSTTIVDEVLDAHSALVSALGRQPEGRLLFRAPGLAWSSPKAVNLNENSMTRYYVGPIHANLGTDAPRADWSCWSQGVSSETCAGWYFQDIVNTGRGIVLAHDIFYRQGRGNTYELLRILLRRLDQEAGGIANKNGQGLWRFVDVQNLSYLDQFEVDSQVAELPAQTTADGFPLIQRFSNGNVFVRSERLIEQGAINDISKIVVGTAGALKVENLIAVADLRANVTIAGKVFRKVRIESTRPGYESVRGRIVYIFSEAF